MITRQIIEALYKKYRRMPKSKAERNLDLLHNFAAENVAVDIEEGKLILYNIDPMSPFNEIRLDNIYGVVDFDDCIAVVLHSSIVFIMKSDASVHVHIKVNPPTFTEKLKWWFER
ncbi:MAG: hypothetical protein K2L49_10045 [Muribaculaceae bacterium]|nr:hypothetical protein [Muribaculaceae bacterium]